MIKESKKLFFKKLDLILEDDFLVKISDSRGYKKYGSVVALSYKILDLKDFFRKEKNTSVIDLTQDIDTVFSKFSDTTRNEIRKTERNKELSFVQDDSNYDNLYILYKDFEFYQKRVPINTEQFKVHTIFSAYYKDKPISAVSVTKSDKELRIRSIFSKRLKTDDKEIYKLISNASRRVIFEVCKWGKENGFESLDMASVNMDNPKTQSIAKFKMSFGGDTVTEYTYIYKSELFSLFEKFTFTKLFVLKILNYFRIK